MAYCFTRTVKGSLSVLISVPAFNRDSGIATQTSFPSAVSAENASSSLRWSSEKLRVSPSSSADGFPWRRSPWPIGPKQQQDHAEWMKWMPSSPASRERGKFRKL